ncbi:MAG: arsenate reductase [Ignavibacteria bacterium RIFCSPLOWO2_02_FULL_55_14]|nr:MAG: arsenate reductase [Ignavibacteria bacterium GWC2_56_12]OGU66741.1 MAG: arsenate reductase [Ignavibacteria bacterium RIFCSPHIGHO2_02_FULL_56_12]OGU70900.1 MAG: arsenate reductase [Ignavibacteria bacterium RIFCSPLOWO2_12_FULL_56_21]OGU73362.1 MAG: arsenate reductase [Ignavibacteria bacterium RIFCSPLOWO2_02_FULL_55_14]HAV22096.1 arsenate reductase ArsC [Bacteroidota bacterium]
MPNVRVLFVCVHNSARSQMAEALLNHIAGDKFEAESAGLEAGTLNPLAVEAMKEMGIDISKKQTRKVFDIYLGDKIFSYVITVCDEASAERCPIFPGITKRLHWSFPDPEQLVGSHEEKLRETIAIRNQIQIRIEAWIRETVGPIHVN